MKYLGLTKCYVGIENNKPDAIAKMREALKDISQAEVVELRSTYPQGAEQSPRSTKRPGKTLKAGQLPASVGCILSNVTTIMTLGEYFRTGMPLVKRTVTVAGDAIVSPSNVVAPVGTKYYDLAEFCGGYKSAPKKIIAGGPMMGKAQNSDGGVLVKTPAPYFSSTKNRRRCLSRLHVSTAEDVTADVLWA